MSAEEAREAKDGRVYGSVGYCVWIGSGGGVWVDEGTTEHLAVGH